MKNFVWVLLAAATLLLPLSARASYHLTSVKWIVDNRNKLTYDDHYVTIIGHVTRRIGDEEYWFTDGTGSIRLDSENFDLPIGERIVVGGRIDEAYLGFGHIEVDVRAWHHAPLHKTTTTVAIAHPAPAKAASSAPAPAPAPTPAPAATLAPPPVSTEAPAPSVISTPPSPATTPPESTASGPTAADSNAPAATTPATATNASTLVPPTETGK
jgi:uncharacterized protein YdeI (BOF family)